MALRGLPVNQCSGLQGGRVQPLMVGTTWTTFRRAKRIFPQAQGADPSIAIAANNTIYYSYVRNEPVGGRANPARRSRPELRWETVPETTINWVNEH